MHFNTIIPVRPWYFYVQRRINYNFLIQWVITIKGTLVKFVLYVNIPIISTTVPPFREAVGFTFLQLNTTNSTLDTYQQRISDLMLKPDLNRSWAKIVNIGTELRSISHPTMAAVPGMVLHMTVLSHC